MCSVAYVWKFHVITFSSMLGVLWSLMHLQSLAGSTILRIRMMTRNQSSQKKSHGTRRSPTIQQTNSAEIWNLSFLVVVAMLDMGFVLRYSSSFFNVFYVVLVCYGLGSLKAEKPHPLNSNSNRENQCGTSPSKGNMTTKITTSKRVLSSKMTGLTG